MIFSGLDDVSRKKPVTPAKAGAHTNIGTDRSFGLGSSLRWNDDVVCYSDGGE